MGDWREAFFAQLPHTKLDRSTGERQLEQAMQQAHQAWPKFPRDEVGFARYLGGRVSAETDAFEALEKAHLGDLLLAFHTLRGTPQAETAFNQTVDQAVEVAVRRLDSSGAFLDEVKQAVRVKLLVPEGDKAPRLGNYRGSGKLRSWVQVVAVRIALELIKRRKPVAASDESLAEVAAGDDNPELAHIKDLYRAEFKAAFHQALATLTSRERNMLRLILIDGLSITDLGELYQIHRSTASRQLATAREKLMDETRERLLEVLDLSPEQFFSLLQTIRSHLDLSLDQVL